MQSRLYLLLSVLLSASTLIAANSGVRSPDVLPVHRRADEKSDNKAGDQLSAEQRAEQGLAPGIDGDLKQDHAHHGPKHRECKICKLETVCACAFVPDVLIIILYRSWTLTE
jgi:hypothetical protein